ncbi:MULTISPECIES: alpha/beta hydrolase [Streptomyces]|uniref:alpha/beta hydrolase n=1 Tax=Streptomyces sp. Ru87 TaxID=2044307 RepID=UPI001F15F32F|nr:MULTISPECIES: alpha/beta hydrolase [Streptomyces]
MPELGSSSTTSWFSGSPASRAALVLALVLILLATSGWTAIRNHRPEPGPRAAALTAWAHGRVDGRELPDPGASAEAVAEFFLSLDRAQRRRLADRYPLVVGNLGGVPLTLRYRANREALRQARAAEEERTHDRRLTDLGRLQAVRRVHRFTSMLGHGRQILAFDPTGGGRAAEVFGDLASARRVSVVVPGVDTDLLSFERTRRKYTAPAGMAQALYAAEREAAPRARTAVIAWADYTTPAGIGVDAAAGRLAEEGAVRLGSLVDSLPGGSRVSLFCHSYGSVVCGVAAPSLPSRVTDIAVSGSPGMRAGSAADLGGRARIWATRDADDWIEDVPNLELGALGHGPDPVSPSFGARLLSAAGARGHAGYFEPGTASLRNFAKVGVGALGSVSCSGGGDGCRTGANGSTAV